MATSVLPKPTSPQTRRSIGRAASRSPSTSAMARAWSGVSSKGNVAAKARYSSSIGGTATPTAALRSA